MTTRQPSNRSSKPNNTTNRFNVYQTRPAAALNPRQSYLLGHRGARGEQLENSAAGFDHLQQLHRRYPKQLVGIEFDVQLTADNKLLVHHDDTLSRLQQRQSRIDQCNSTELLRYPLQGNRHLLLEDMAPYLNGYQRIELEVKTHERSNYQRLTQALAQALLDPSLKPLPITLTSFDVTLHQYMLNHPVLSQYPRGLLVEPKFAVDTASMVTKDEHADFQPTMLMSTNAPLMDTALIAKRLGCQGVGLFFPLYDLPSQSSQQLLQSFRHYQLTTTAWTVNEPQHAKRLINLGVNYIISDFPSRLVTLF
ncbi:glycerophosphodiester phosphodiesterase [Psychrobacter sp. FDAARGOS_221]|uniref:glycerophosphodiester phosphodiesterase n=1 Tax=Psychrobacter sp. FDAARGOS_221 TaxID=1975705 RepID=UPI000BB53189|nr:glycerophosphodiester phosphodiesterase [Psychrobacter sp. FDAARGOS_221]PNK59514.1 glycerophosphodiester phosphodiesterase [Psychrobacter sp. FDAARGOS_221]